MIEELSYQSLAILAAAGVLATVVNVLAGGGGMIVLPALMALGLPADVANGTYRLGVVTQSIAGATAMRREGKLDTGSIVPILIPAVLGATVGALLATRVPPEVLKPIMLGTMILMAALIVFRKQTLIPGRRPHADSARSAALLRRPVLRWGLRGLHTGWGGFSVARRPGWNTASQPDYGQRTQVGGHAHVWHGLARHLRVGGLGVMGAGHRFGGRVNHWRPTRCPPHAQGARHRTEVVCVRMCGRHMYRRLASIVNKDAR